MPQKDGTDGNYNTLPHIVLVGKGNPTTETKPSMLVKTNNVQTSHPSENLKGSVEIAEKIGSTMINYLEIWPVLSSFWTQPFLAARALHAFPSFASVSPFNALCFPLISSIHSRSKHTGSVTVLDRGRSYGMF